MKHRMRLNARLSLATSHLSYLTNANKTLDLHGMEQQACRSLLVAEVGTGPSCPLYFFFPILAPERETRTENCCKQVSAISANWHQITTHAESPGSFLHAQLELKKVLCELEVSHSVLILSAILILCSEAHAYVLRKSCKCLLYS